MFSWVRVCCRHASQQNGWLPTKRSGSYPSTSIWICFFVTSPKERPFCPPPVYSYDFFPCSKCNSSILSTT